jgi:hypothetical protein
MASESASSTCRSEQRWCSVVTAPRVSDTSTTRHFVQAQKHSSAHRHSALCDGSTSRSGNGADELQSLAEGIHGKSKRAGVLCIGVEGREN